MKRLNIACIQTDIEWESKQDNFKKIERQYLQSIDKETVDLIILPEMFATGFTMKPSEFWEAEDGPTVTWLKHWANTLNTTIAGGMITKDQTGYKNTFMVCYPNGETKRYDKRHLFRMGEENKHYSPGQFPQIIDINNWKINLQVCYDLRFPAFARNQILPNQSPAYDVLIYIANWPQVRTYAWRNLLRSRAIENQAFTIGVNRVGDDGNGIAHSGDTAVIDPNGHYLLEPVEHASGIYQTTLTYDKLENARQKFPVLLDADQIEITD